MLRAQALAAGLQVSVSRGGLLQNQPDPAASGSKWSLLITRLLRYEGGHDKLFFLTASSSLLSASLELSHVRLCCSSPLSQESTFFHFGGSCTCNSPYVCLPEITATASLAFLTIIRRVRVQLFHLSMFI